ncbi:MAG TPA: hypothetical protein VM433_07845 [Mycobacteriales bacterium]|nr:hypothetical protein [Mycobacteriales bacterium]
MRRVLGGVAAAALVLSAAPALANGDVVDEPVLLEACEVQAGAERLTADGATGTIETPSFLVGDERTVRTFVLDLAGNPVGTTASIDTTMTWLVPANDYDLEVVAGRTGGTSENYQPFDAAEENVFVAGVGHCQKVEVNAIDFLSPVVVDSLDLALVVKPKRP